MLLGLGTRDSSFVDAGPPKEWNASTQGKHPFVLSCLETEINRCSGVTTISFLFEHEAETGRLTGGIYSHMCEQEPSEKVKSWMGDTLKRRCP